MLPFFFPSFTAMHRTNFYLCLTVSEHKMVSYASLWNGTSYLGSCCLVKLETSLCLWAGMRVRFNPMSSSSSSSGIPDSRVLGPTAYFTCCHIYCISDLCWALTLNYAWEREREVLECHRTCDWAVWRGGSTPTPHMWWGAMRWSTVVQTSTQGSASHDWSCGSVSVSSVSSLTRRSPFLNLLPESCRLAWLCLYRSD